MIETTYRNEDLQTIAQVLQDQRAMQADMIVGAGALHMKDGVLHVTSQIEEVGLTSVTKYRPTKIFNEGVSAKLGIPGAFLQRLYETRDDLYDQLVNGLLRGSKPFRSADGTTEQKYPGSTKRFLIRAFMGDDEVGLARAFLSDQYKVIDNLDVLLATLQGVRDAGVKTDIKYINLSERRMIVKIEAPEIRALAPELLKGYRSPFSGKSGDENPVVSAGFIISNSETGGGAFNIVPSMTVQICDNGMTIQKDAMKSVHLGSKNAEGQIKWSDETQKKTVELVGLKTRDAVKTFLDVDYMKGVIADLEAKSSKEVTKPSETVERVTKSLLFSKEQQQSVLDHFIKGGQMTAGGVMQAITSACQTVEDPDVAFDMELSAVKALDLV